MEANYIYMYSDHLQRDLCFYFQDHLVFDAQKISLFWLFDSSDSAGQQILISVESYNIDDENWHNVNEKYSK